MRHILLAALMVGCAGSGTEGTVRVVAPGEGGEWDDPSVAHYRYVYSTIQAAIDASNPGDVVEVSSGSYAETLTLKDGVRVRGAGMNETSVVGGVDAYDTFDGSSALEALSVESAGDGRIDGIYVQGGTLKLQGVRALGFEKGMRIYTSANVYVDASEFLFNDYGFWSDDSTNLTVQNSLFRSNYVSGLTNYTTDGAVLFNTFVANAFVGSSNQEYGGAIQLGVGDTEVVANNIVVSNFYGINCQGCGNSFTNNIVWGNNTNYANEASNPGDDLNLDPRFLSAASFDYRLASDSPAIDAGNGAWGTVVDFQGESRPQGAAYDIGMDEFASSDVSLQITEVMANATVETVLEFVELYNPGAQPVELAGLGITDGDDLDTLTAFAGGTTLLAPGAYAVVVDPDYDGSYNIPGGVTVVTTADTNVGNGLTTSDEVSVVESDGTTVVTSFSYPIDPGDGVSLEMVVRTNGDVSGNWRASVCVDGHSAGSDPCFPPSGDPTGLIVTEVMSNAPTEATQEYLELFNPTDLEIDAAGLIVDDGDNTDTLRGFANSGTLIGPGEHALILDPGYDYYWSLPNGITLLTTGDQSIGDGLATTDPVSLFLADGTTLVDSFSFPSNPGDGVAIEKLDYAAGDVANNWADHSDSCARGVSPGRLNGGMGGICDQLMITEVMSNADNEDTGEFVEILHTGAEAVDLAGLTLTDGTDVDTLTDYGNGTLLQPGQYAVVVDSEYAGEYTIPAEALVVTTDDTTLGNSLSVTDNIVLAEGDYMVDTYQYPFNAGNGVSVERLSLNATDAAANWVASTCASGSSPGADNCATGGTVGGSGSSLYTIVISEIMANADDEDTGEYVEIYNYGTDPVDLHTFVLWDGDQLDTLFGLTFLDDTILEPGAYAVIVDAEYAYEYTSIPYGTLMLTTGDDTLGSGLSTSDEIFLFEPDGQTLVDSFTSPSNPGNAVSIEKRDLLGGDITSNWQASTCPAGHSPGESNCQ